MSDEKYLVGLAIGAGAIDPLEGFTVKDDLSSVNIKNGAYGLTGAGEVDIPTKDFLANECFYIYDTENLQEINSSNMDEFVTQK